MKWDIDKAHAVLWVASEAANALLGSMKDKLGIRFTEHLCYIKNHRFKWCTLESENEEIGEFLVERFKNKSFTKRFIKGYHKFEKKAIKQLNQIDKLDFSKIDDNRLFKILKESNDMYIENLSWTFIAEPMDFVMPVMIESRLRKNGYTQEEISDMLAIANITFLNREAQELIAIAKSSKTNELLKKHAYKYRWIQSDHMGRKDIPFSYFKANLDKLKQEDLSKELRKLKNFRLDIVKRKKQILAKKPIDKETKVLLKIVEIIAPIHDTRKELFLRSIYSVDSARAEIAKRYGYTKDELSVFEIKDLSKLKHGEKLDKKKAKALLKEALFYVDTKKKIWRYYSGKKARAFMKKELSEEIGDVVEIKGMVASLGKAKGIVKIIHGTRDMDKMNEGDILVSSMTKPEIVSAIKKAAAIVTDEGGVTCHAAIVSREFRIPCIIGTKIATRLLKDGDLVEVNVVHGFVRILKRK